MKPYKAALAAVLLAAATAACTSASEKTQNTQTQAASAAPSRASLEELFNVSDFDNTMDMSFKQMPAIAKQQVEASLTDVPAQKRAAVQQVVEKYLNLMVQETNTPELRAEIRRSAIEGAAKVYTQGEVDALVRFYKSPEGRSVMAKMPQYMEATMTPMMQAMQPGIQAFQQKHRVQMEREINQAVCGKNTCPKTNKK